MDLSGAVNATISDNQGLGTITNDDQVPDISVDDQTVAEGNSPTTTPMTFNVTLSNPSDQTVTVGYTTNDGTATIADGDYVAASGTVTFLADETAKTVDVTVNGDDTTEPDEALTLDLSNATNANILDGSGLGTVTNDDPIPDVSIDDPSLQKEHQIQCAANFPLLCDVDKHLTEQLGILNENGRSRRTTYLIDKTGAIAKVFEGVKVDGHVSEVLEAAKAMA